MFSTSVNIVMADQYTKEEIQAIFEEYNNATKGGSQATAELTKRFKDAQTGLKNYTDQLNSSLQKLGSSMLGVAKAMKDGEQGAAVYNDSINSFADAIDSFLSKFGLLGQMLGTVLTAGARYVAEVNKQSDALFKTYKDLSSSGLADAGGMRTIFDNMQKFGYGVNELGNMTELLKANSKELSAFGGTAASGTKAFADAAGEIQRSDVGKSLQMLGKTPDEINKGMALFVKQQQQAGVSSSAIQANLAQKSADYIKNLDVLSKLTGDDAAKLQEKLDAAMAEDAFNQTIYELKKKAAAGDAEAGRLASEYENAARRLTGEALKEFQQGVGGDISAMGKTLMAAGDAVGMIGKSSFTASGYIDTLTKGVVQQRNQQGELLKMNAGRDFMFAAKEMSDLESRNAEKTAQAQEDRAKAEQELQTKGLDPATKAQVELRIEQMKTRDEFQSLINKGINPVTKGMATLASGIESVTDKLPGSGTSTGTKMGGGETGSNWWNPSTWGKGGKTPPSAPGATGLGAVSAQFEGAGAGTVSSGKGDHGGASYGTYQLSSKMGQVQQFLKENEKYSKEFEGLTAGTEDFNKKWKELGGDKGFAEAQQAFAKKQYYDAQVQTLGEMGKKLTGKGRGVQEALFSTGVQYGGGSKLIEKALAGKDVDQMGEKDIINAIQDYKAQNVSSNFKSSSADVQRGVANRIERERAALMASSTAGPSTGYDSKMAGIQPDKTLPAKVEVAANRPEGYDSEQSKGFNDLLAALEQSNRLQSEQADQLARIRQNTAA
jgi:hypothetical protein